MDSEICMWKTGIMATSYYKNLFLNGSLPLMINSCPEHFSQGFKNFHFKLQLIFKKVAEISQKYLPKYLNQIYNYFLNKLGNWRLILIGVLDMQWNSAVETNIWKANEVFSHK